MTRTFKCCDIRRRYAILVDNVFPKKNKSYAQENVDKLIFYVVSSPEKLDRIAARLHLNMLNHLKNRRIDQVIIAAEVMNQLLNTSRTSFLNLMVDDYLNMILKMLDDEEPKLKISASQSFRKFANIDAETSSFDLYIPSFVLQFVRLCSSKNSDDKSDENLRISGLVGIQGLILKCTKTQLTQTIWSSNFLDQIIPALIDNLKLDEKGIPMNDDVGLYFANESKEGEGFSTTTSQITQNTELLAASSDPFSCSSVLVSLCNIYELLRSCSMSSATYVVTPIFKYWSKNDLWQYYEPSRRLLNFISRSLSPQNQHIFVQLYFSVLFESKSSLKMIKDIISPLSDIFTKQTSSSLGSNYLEAFNYLILFLKDSNALPLLSEEIMELEALLVAIIEKIFTNLALFQKSEAFYLILSKFIFNSKAMNIFSEPSDTEFMRNVTEISEYMKINKTNESRILLLVLETISMKYNVGKLSLILNLTFFEQLIFLIFLPEISSKITSLSILTNIFDVFNNKEAVIKSMEKDEFIYDDFNFDFEDCLDEVNCNKIVRSLYIVVFCLKNMTSVDVPFFRSATIFTCLCCTYIQSPKISLALINTFVLIQNEIDSEDLFNNIGVIWGLQSLFLSSILCISMTNGLDKLKDVCEKIKKSHKKIHQDFGLPSSLLRDDLDFTNVDESIKVKPKYYSIAPFKINKVFSSDANSENLSIKLRSGFLVNSDANDRKDSEYPSLFTINERDDSIFHKPRSNQNENLLEISQHGDYHPTDTDKKSCNINTLDTFTEILSKNVPKQSTGEDTTSQETYLAKRNTFYRADEYFS